MCSISGIISISNSKKNLIYKMIEAQSHRAPDESGVFFDNDIALGMGRLKIIDLKSKNITPFISNNYVLTYNGEIYNYIELKKELKDLGVKFRTNSDTEVLLKAWETWGEKTFSKLNGMFAFCIYDKRTKRLVLARDIAGEKPLYYSQNKKEFYFSSEAKALKFVANPILQENNFYKSFQYCLDETILKDIYQIKPAHYLIYDLNNGKFYQKEYWKFKKKKIFLKEAEEELDHLIKDSVRLRFRSDVKMGIYSSGGVDSSLLSSYGLFKYKFYFNDKINYLKDFKKKIDKITYHLDFPVGSLSSYPLYVLAQRAKKKVKVVVSGEGADEIFGGYVRYMPIANDYYLNKKFPSYKNFFKDQKDYIAAYTRLVLKNNNISLAQKLFSPIFEMFEDPINAMGFIDFKYVMPSLLQMGDRMSGAFGLENRCPFLDKRIIEFGFSLPPEKKIFNMNQKIILQDLLKKKNPKFNFQQEKKGLFFNLKNWQNQKDRFRNKYFSTIEKSWLTNN
jgi:asparagine synthase (glutamine-hydrolysing)